MYLRITETASVWFLNCIYIYIYVIVLNVCVSFFSSTNSNSKAYSLNLILIHRIIMNHGKLCIFSEMEGLAGKPSCSDLCPLLLKNQFVAFV